MKNLIALSLLATLAFGGCYRVTVSSTRAPSGVVREKTAHMFLWGLIGADVTAPCDPAQVTTKQGVIDWILAGLTAGLYTPYSVEVECAQGTASIETNTAPVAAR